MPQILYKEFINVHNWVFPMLVLINLLYQCAHTICSMSLVRMAHFRPLNKVTAQESHAHGKNRCYFAKSLGHENI